MGMGLGGYEKIRGEVQFVPGRRAGWLKAGWASACVQGSALPRRRGSPRFRLWLYTFD